MKKKRILSLLIFSVTSFVFSSLSLAQPFTSLNFPVTATFPSSVTSSPSFRSVNQSRTELFKDAVVLKTKNTALNAKGEFIRYRIVKVEAKNPYILIESQIQKDVKTGKEKILKSTAMVANQVVVTLHSCIPRSELEKILIPVQGKIVQKMAGADIYLVSLSSIEIETLPNALKYFLAQSNLVKTANENGVGFLTFTPNDPNFLLLWGLHNSGQTLGTVDADIDAPEAWDLTTGSNTVVVAVIDTGVDYNHPELSANMWHNPGEIPGNGIDEDGNGKADDYYGYDFSVLFGPGAENPMDIDNHGSHCAGIIGAKGNNNIGVAGVTWNVQIMSVKIINSLGFAFSWDLADGLNYARLEGAHLISGSVGGFPNDNAVQQAINNAQTAGILIMFAAGNDTNNTDVSINYPSCYTNSNILSVAATTDQDGLAYFSNYGLQSVDLGAPGLFIRSTIRVSEGSYGYLSGTSMATPYVTGVAALIKSLRPEWKAPEIKQAIMSNVDPIASLNGKCVTGGRLNAFKAVNASKLPNYFHFSTNSYSVNEATATITISVTRTGWLNQSAFVHFTTSNSTAIADFDYFATNGVLTWAAGSGGTKTFSIKITNDVTFEGNESFHLHLFSPSNAFLMSPSNAILTIVEDDPSPAGILTLLTNAFWVNETDASLQITVTRTDGTNGQVSVFLPQLMAIP